MRLTKMFGLAALAAVAAMAFVGASSASAETATALCTKHTELGCSGALVGSIKFLSLTSVLKTSIATVLCLGSHGTAVVENAGNLAKAGERLNLETTELTWLECGTNAEHNNCTVTTEKLPLLEVLKTALNLGFARVKAGSALVKVQCGALINCKYSEPVEGKEFHVEGAVGETPGMLTANELEVEKAGGFFCPSVSKWTTLYDIYQLNGENGYLTD